jgi:DNA polymerase III epsilon subunit-like protein
MNIVNNLIGKKVLFVDTETTGFPKRSNGYPDYTDNKKYDSSRIVQFGYCYYENFNTGFEINCDNIKSIIRKPFNFKYIPKCVVDIHGITYKHAKENGTLIKKIFKGDFGQCLLDCDYFVAYNAFFDFSILANEIHRAKKTELYDKMITLRDTDRVTCMMKISTMYLGKRLSQSKVYHIMYNKSAENQHDAKGDVMAMLYILKYIIDNPDAVKNVRMKDVQYAINGGNPWIDDEEKQLKRLYIEENKNIKEIAKIHKRTVGAITSKIKKLDLLKYDDNGHKDGSFKINKQLEEENVILKEIMENIHLKTR